MNTKNKIKKGKLNFMEPIHQQLMKKSSWYRAWHTNKGHKLAHWAVFVVVALLFTGLLYARINNVGFLGQLRGLFSHASANVYYVRNGGGSPSQCSGTTNANYSGSGSNQACAFNDVADAINVASFGDTIKLHAGDTFSTQKGYAFGEWWLTDKGTPPTNTDADYITITTDDPSGTPSALSGYPANQTRVTTAMAANMPHVRAEGATPLFRVKNGAKYWKVERLDISNTDNGWQNVVFINNDDPGPASQAAVPHDITIQYNWIHPAEETGTPLSASNLSRTAENAIYLSARNFTLQNNAIQGFVGLAKYGGSAGGRITSSGWLTAYAFDSVVRNNLVEAWTYALFLGGSGMPDWSVTGGGTASSCTQTSCVFSNTSNLNVGDPFAIYVSSLNEWGDSFVKSISGNTVTFDSPLCHTYNGGNSCTAMTGSPLPSNGAAARWKGLLPNNIQIRQNIFAHYPEWTSFLSECGGKGYLEIKSGSNIVFDGNIFTGCTGPTITVRNQADDFPWVALDGLTFSNNLWKNSQQPFTGFFRDSSPTPKTKNVSWVNNLYTGLAGSPQTLSGGVFSGNFGGASNVNISHNTIAWSPTNNPGMTKAAYRNFLSYYQTTIGGVVYPNTVDGLTMKDNIFPIAANICFNDGSATATYPISQCWPGSNINHNVLVNQDNNLASDISGWWPWTGNTVANSYSSVGFTSPNSNMDASGNYRLLASSPYHNAASDGKDIGVDMDQLNNAIFGTNTVPINPPPAISPVISSFSASPASITAGSSSTLSWAVSGASSVSISNIGGVSGSSQSVSPTATTTYVLTATNSGGSVTASTTVTVSAVVNQNTSHLSLSPASVSFSAVSGDATPAAKTVAVSNTGTGSSSWSAVANQAWCHISPASGFLAAGASSNLSVSVDSPSNVGTFSCSISLTDSNADNSPQAIAVSYSVAAAPTPSATPSITSFSVSSKSGSSATITWTTDQPTIGTVKYGTSKTNLSLSVADSVLKTTHSATITGLSAKSTYYYQISASNTTSGSSTTIISSFRTKPR